MSYCAEGHTDGSGSASSRPVLRSRRPQTRLDTFCTRTGRPPRCPRRSGPAGEGRGRTARMHVREESHRGIVPMNSSNQGGRSPAEKREGRLRHKENTHEPSTHPTQCGARVSQGLVGVRPFGRSHPSEEPYALTSARTDLCGGCWVTSIPTASVPSMFDSLRVKVPLTT